MKNVTLDRATALQLDANGTDSSHDTGAFAATLLSFSGAPLFMLFNMSTSFFSAGMRVRCANRAILRRNTNAIMPPAATSPQELTGTIFLWTSARLRTAVGARCQTRNL